MAEDRWLVLPPDGLIFAISPTGNVAIRMDYSRKDTGLAPNVHLAVEFSPAEAREIAQTLLRKADEAEKRGSLR